MDRFLSVTLNGLSGGMIYAAVALSLLLVAMLSSKGASGVTGAGFIGPESGANSHLGDRVIPRGTRTGRATPRPVRYMKYLPMIRSSFLRVDSGTSFRSVMMACARSGASFRASR